jgi:hypothetical protein
LTANKLLHLSNIFITIKDLEECTSSFFVAIFEALANEHVYERLPVDTGLKVHKRPITTHHHIDNVFAVLYCLHLQFPWIGWWNYNENDDEFVLGRVSTDSELALMYKTAESIVCKDKDVIAWLVNRLYDISITKNEICLSKLTEIEGIRPLIIS